ncbi:hypothetical protein [Planococcus salinus]|uniref:Uncharacterized protein n=1 Tax=Planococcus salinus TaxID=1848460 RepID=A0A3M8P5V6_9BACL|nr:hypothetical protein [Planococcus salinus]RNF39045.1 hypothetical protein EEX84_11710 [Planococcus salinus]
MKETRYSWKSYSFLGVSIVVSLAMIFIDFLVSVLHTGMEVILVYTIFIGSLVSLGLAVLTFSDKREKKKMAIAALLLTIINVGAIAYFLWFGGQYV